MSEHQPGGWKKLLRKAGLIGGITAAGMAGAELARKPIERAGEQVAGAVESLDDMASMGVVVDRNVLPDNRVELTIKLTTLAGEEGTVVVPASEARKYDIGYTVRVQYDEEDDGIDIASVTIEDR